MLTLFFTYQVNRNDGVYNNNTLPKSDRVWDDDEKTENGGTIDIENEVSTFQLSLL